uniref:Uncharacterized protein n=1 Tax=Oryza barthii TaxID=65489 RepID=A0A0D3GFT0_9ORYZ
MTLDDVNCLLGLPSKGEEIFEAPKPEFNDDHFIRRLILFSVGSFICPTTQRYVCSEYLNLVDDMEKNEATKLVKSNPESIVNDIRGTIECKEIPGEKEQTKDSETHSNQNIQCTSDEIAWQMIQNAQIEKILRMCLRMLNKNKMILGSLSNHHEEAYINPNINTTCETKEDSNQCNQSSERLTGPIGRTYKPTTRTDFCYESRGKKDIIRTQTPTKITLVYIEKEDLTKKNIHKSPSKNALRGLKKIKTISQTPIKNSEEPEYLNDNVMDAYIQCLRNKEKGIREMAMPS